jgi:signal transduction histidine kinase
MSATGGPAPGEGARALYGRLVRLAVAAGALVLLGIVTASAFIAAQTEANVAEAEQSQVARFTTTDVLDALISAESSQRGYLLTGKPEYLSPYTAAAARIPVLLGRLETVLPGDPTVAAWRAAIERKMAELDETVKLQLQGQHEAALALVETDRGRRDMVQARAAARTLMESQRAALSRDLLGSRSGTRLLVGVDVLGLVVLVLLTLFVASSLRQSVRALARSRQELQEANLALQAGRDRLEAAVAERTADLTNANEEIQRFAYIVSHDLRAPLLNIIGFTGELQTATNRLNRFVSEHLEPAGIVVPEEVREASQADLPEAIRFIQTSTTKMDRLITAILKLSREGRRVLTPEPLDMTALLGGILDSVRHQADAAGARLTLNPLPPLVCDRLAVEQVFSNLIENALKYLAPGRAGVITLEGGSTDAAGKMRMVRYEVRDNGRGIAPRDRERIFELFRRAGPQDTPGEGIGLAHVRALLRRLGGTIDCESTPGEGSNFIVHLPAEPVQSGASGK